MPPAGFGSLLDALLAPGGPRVPSHRTTSEAQARFGYERADETLATLGLPLDSLPGLRVLEIGSGFGGLTQRLSELGATVIGVDLNEDRVRAARTIFPDASYEVADSARLPFADEQFDAIVANDVLEHLLDLPGALEEWRRTLSPTGKGFVSTVHWRSRLGSHAYDYVTLPWPHLYLPNRMLASYWLRKRREGASAGELPAPERDGRRLEDVFHLNRLTLASLRRAAQTAGLSISDLELHVRSRKLKPALRVPVLRELAADDMTLKLARI